jgi:hypothetical protein
VIAEFLESAHSCVQQVVDMKNHEMKKDQNRFVYAKLDDFSDEKDRMDKDAITLHRKRNDHNKYLYW